MTIELLLAAGTTQPAGADWPSIIKIIGGSAAAILVVIGVFVGAIKKGRPRTKKVGQGLPSPNQYLGSFVVHSTMEETLENLRSGDPERVCLALQLVTNTVVPDERIVAELTSLIGKQGPYSAMQWLTPVFRCRICRFLHLALERKGAAESGKRFDNGARFDVIFWAIPEDCCCICGERDLEEGFLGRLWQKVTTLFEGSGNE